MARTPAQEQADVEKLVAQLAEAVTRTTNMIADGTLSGGYRFKSKGGKMEPDTLVEAEEFRLKAMELIVMLTGDYDEEQYASWSAVLEEHKKSLDRSKHKWTGGV